MIRGRTCQGDAHDDRRLAVLAADVASGRDGEPLALRVRQDLTKQVSGALHLDPRLLARRDAQVAGAGEVIVDDMRDLGGERAGLLRGERETDGEEASGREECALAACEVGRVRDGAVGWWSIG